MNYGKWWNDVILNSTIKGKQVRGNWEIFTSLLIVSQSTSKKLHNMRSEEKK